MKKMIITIGLVFAAATSHAAECKIITEDQVLHEFVIHTDLSNQLIYLEGSLPYNNFETLEFERGSRYGIYNAKNTPGNISSIILERYMRKEMYGTTGSITITYHNKRLPLPSKEHIFACIGFF